MFTATYPGSFLPEEEANGFMSDFRICRKH